MTDRAVSTTVGYVLLLGMTVILLAGLSVTATGLLESQQERTIETELNVIGERLAADIMTADRLAQRDSEPEVVTVTTELPQMVSDVDYTIEIRREADQVVLVLQTTDPHVSTKTGLSNTTDIDTGILRGGTVTITYTDETVVVSND